MGQDPPLLVRLALTSNSWLLSSGGGEGVCEACLPAHPALLLWQALTWFALLLRGNEEGPLFEACPHPPLPGWRWLPQQEAYLIRQDEAQSTRATCFLHVVQVFSFLCVYQGLWWSVVTTYYNHCFVFRMRCKIVV